MKYLNKIIYITALLLIVAGLTTCSGSKKQKEEDKLSIVTTLFPNYDFARQIAS